MRPLFFGPPERPLFGWIHPGEGTVGLVVCNPFGYEAVCAHRSLRHLASTGAPAIRFDYDGTGDSAGTDLDPDRVTAWTESIGHAIDALKRETGVMRVVLLGVRLGALLALLASAGRDDVDSLVAIAPVVSGRAYLRELKLLQMALGLREAPAGTNAGAKSSGQEALGFVITEETVAALSKLDATKLAAPSKVLLLDRIDMPAAGKWAQMLGERAVAKSVAGYVEMVLDPHKAEVPAAMIDAVERWLGTKSAAATLEGTATAELDGVRETAVTIDGRVFGILTEGTGRASSKAILLLNAGAVHHIGPNRLHVTFARLWAQRGYTVLRLDLSGIGDSPGAPENVVYTERATTDVAAAARFLRGKASEVVGAGLCSGGYHGFTGVLAGAPLDEVILINPLTFDRRPLGNLDWDASKVIQVADQYGESVLKLEKWMKLARGDVKLRFVAEALAHRAFAVAKSRARELARLVGHPLEDDLGAIFESLAKRNVRVRFVFAADDPGIRLLRTEAGSAVEHLQASGKLRIATIDGPDHTFTAVWSHEVLERALGFT